MDIVKVKDDIHELEMADEEIVLGLEQLEQVDNSVSTEGTLEIDECVGALVTVSEDRVSQHALALSPAQEQRVRKQRLCFSEADDMVLLENVAVLNPYKNAGLWKGVAQIVAASADKNFSLRCVRNHTELLMNTMSLRGVEACLKRTPPGLKRKKKQLLEEVHNFWKNGLSPLNQKKCMRRDSKRMKAIPTDVPQGSQTSDSLKSEGSPLETEMPSASSPVPFMPILSSILRSPSTSISADSRTMTPMDASHAGLQTSDTDSLKSNEFLSKSTSIESVMAAVPKPIFSSPISTVVPQLLQQPKIAVTAQGGAPAQTIACVPEPAGSLSNLPSLPLNSQAAIEAVESTPSFSSATTADLAQQTILQSLDTAQGADNCVPIDILRDELYTPCKNVMVPRMVDQGTFPALPVGGSMAGGVGDASCAISDRLECSSFNETAISRSVVATDDQQSSEEISEICVVRQKRERLLKAKLRFLQKRHVEQLTLKCRKLKLEKRRLMIEEKKLALKERKLQLETEKWLLDKKEREERDS